MKALLLAAGEGTRLRPITLTLPKCLVAIDGRPLLDYWLQLLADSGRFDEIIINTSYLADKVREFIGGSPHRDRITLAHEPTLLGTAGTLWAQRHRYPHEDILVAHADNLTLFPVNDFIECYQSRPTHCLGTMMTFDSDTPSSCGIVELAPSGIVLAMHEKVVNPPGRRANAAVFMFNPGVFDTLTLPTDVACPEISREVIPALLGRLTTFHNTVYHRDIGTPESLACAQAEFPAVYRQFYGKGE